MRRRADQWQAGVSAATLIALFSLLYMIYRNSYNDVIRNVESFEARMAESIKAQNQVIEELRREMRRRR